MPLGNQAFTDSLVDTYTTERYPLGSLRVELPTEVTDLDATHKGERMWVFVHNDEGGAFAKGDILEMGDGAGNGTTGVSAAIFNAVKCNTAAQMPQRLLGVAGHAIADGAYGWVIAKGVCEVAGDGGITAGGILVTNNAARADLATANADATTDTFNAAFGVAIEADGGAGSLFAARINVL